MKAIILKEFGGVENFEYAEIPSPQLKANEVLVNVKAVSVNPADVKTRAGQGMASRLKEEMPLILGWDISGIITQTGKDVTKFKVGDPVFGMINFPGYGRAYAEYVAVPEDHMALKPENISYAEAAAATLTPLTAWQAIVKVAKVKSGDRVLIHAASGGVGHFAVQMAKYLGAYVIGTSSAANKDFVLGLGADEHIDYKTRRFEDVVSDVDFVLDSMGDENVKRSLEVIRPGGSLVSILGLSDEASQKAKTLHINAQQYLVSSNGEDMNTLAGLLQKGILKVHVSKTFPFDKMGDAHLQVESGRSVGKIVVTL